MVTKALLVGALAALAAAQSSVLTFTHVPNPVTDGHPQAITYATNDTQTPVTITLKNGLSSALQTVQVLTTTSTGGQYIWTPPKSIANGDDYALEIKQLNQINYFGPFSIQGADPSAVASASKASASASSANATMTGARNATMTGASNSTTATSSKNVTMTTTKTTGTKGTMTGKMTTGNAASGTSVSFVGTNTAPANQASTGAASPVEYSSSGPMSLVLGAIAALFYFF